MDVGQIIVTIVCSLIAGSGGAFALMQFLIKRKDDKETNSVQKMIDEAVKIAKEEVYKELSSVSKARSEEGAERFKTHAKAFENVNKQIEENTIQIKELTTISKNVLESMDSMGKKLEISAESQRNNNYDRLLMVGKKVLNNQKITLSEKTNMKQLYESYKKLQGNDPYIETLWEECKKLTPIPDEK